MNERTWISIAGFLGAVGVSCGAFGAHWLPEWLGQSGLSATEVSQRMDTFQVGVRYNMYHALALLGVAFLARWGRSRSSSLAGIAFVVGILIFSGLLYVIAVTGVRVLGAVVPVGGVLLIIGWLALAVAAIVAPDNAHES